MEFLVPERRTNDFLKLVSAAAEGGGSVWLTLLEGQVNADALTSGHKHMNQLRESIVGCQVRLFSDAMTVDELNGLLKSSQNYQQVLLAS